LRVPDPLSTVHAPDAELGLGIYDGLLIPPSLLPRSVRGQTRLVVVTDGTAATMERVRSALWSDSGYETAMTPVERATGDEGSALTAGYTRAAEVGVVFALIVAGLSLAATTADALRERRRGLAALVALGTPVRVLRRSVVLQTAVPLLLNIGLATVASIVGSAVYIAIADDDGRMTTVGLPWAGWTGIAVAAVAAVLVATALTLPFVRAAARPEALRTE
jgi:hypothetical protein